MGLSTQQVLSRLGGGESIESLSAASGMRRDQFDAWWKAECQRRVPASQGEVTLPGVRELIRITRDARGLPHVEASVGSSRVDLQACKLEYSIVSPK